MHRLQTVYPYMLWSHVIGYAVAIPLALQYLSGQHISFMSGGPFGFITALYILWMVLYTRHYTFPANEKAALYMFGSVLLNAILTFVNSGYSVGWVAYYFYMTMLVVLNLIVLSWIVVVLFEMQYKLPDFFDLKADFKKGKLQMIAVIALIGSPFSITLIYCSEPLIRYFDSGPVVETFLIISAFVHQIVISYLQVFRTILPGNVKKDVQRERLKSNEGEINMIFFIVLIWILILMFLQ